eukprot:TRINITY_DN714_c0_g1_i4.p1 TRINITY_DN714_c0_g1~~TRINITY_DN714_c0_g1_i4.p1  ORF type:complete len:234 (+),score=13.11 TRINITY_DN714_c0_g1_i4:604-1305(+)
MVKIWKLEAVEWNKLWCFDCGQPAHGLSKTLQKELRFHREAINTFAEEVEKPRMPIPLARQVGIVQQTYKAAQLFKDALEKSRSRSRSPSKSPRKDLSKRCTIEVIAVPAPKKFLDASGPVFPSPPSFAGQPGKHHTNNLQSIMLDPRYHVAPLPTALQQRPTFVTASQLREPGGSPPNNGYSNGFHPTTSSPLSLTPLSRQSAQPNFLYPNGWLQVKTPTAGSPQPMQRPSL